MINHNLHHKASDLLALHAEMKARIDYLKSNTEYYTHFPNIIEKHLNKIDTCKRGLERIEQAYIKVLTEILAL
jgi:hypothetical protein